MNLKNQIYNKYNCKLRTIWINATNDVINKVSNNVEQNIDMELWLRIKMDLYYYKSFTISYKTKSNILKAFK